jgi:iron complex transport system substrate-binding protein
LLPAGVATYAVDADAHWARPGPRVVEGVADLRNAIGRQG